jgi:hypothetical protein
MRSGNVAGQPRYTGLVDETSELGIEGYKRGLSVLRGSE